MNKKRLILCFIPFVNVIFWYIITMKNSHKMTKGWQFKIILCMAVSVCACSKTEGSNETAEAVQMQLERTEDIQKNITE